MIRLRDHQLSTAYLNAMDEARRTMDELSASGWPVPRLVWRARALYRQIHRDELIRHRSAAATD